MRAGAAGVPSVGRAALQGTAETVRRGGADPGAWWYRMRMSDVCLARLGGSYLMERTVWVRAQRHNGEVGVWGK